MHCCLVQSRSLRKRKKKNSTSPTCYFVSKHLLHFQLQQQTKTRASWPHVGSWSPDQQGARGQAACLLYRVNATKLRRPSSRGWVHPQAFSYLHPMGALQPHKEEKPVTVQAQQTSSCRTGGYHRVRGESDLTPRGSFKTPRGLVADADRSHSPEATLFRWAPPLPQGSQPRH